MKSKFQLSNNQNIFFENLLEFSNKIERNKLIENISSIIENNSFSSNKIQFQLDTQESFEKIFEELYYPIQKLLDLLANFMNLVNPWYSYKKYKSIFFDDTLGSLNQYHIEMSSDFELEEKKLKVTDGNILDYIIIKSNDNPQLQNIKKNLIIICGPNGSAYQYFCKNLRLENYLKQGIDVILDDRSDSFGVKAHDWDLIGVPYSIVVGRDAKVGLVEFKKRTSDEKSLVDVKQAVAELTK
jgi:hypothetical protein